MTLTSIMKAKEVAMAVETRVYYLKSAGAASALRREALGSRLDAHVALTDAGFRVTVSGDAELVRLWDASHPYGSGAPKAA
jgi:hypothetical protein